MMFTKVAGVLPLRLFTKFRIKYALFTLLSCFMISNSTYTFAADNFVSISAGSTGIAPECEYNSLSNAVANASSGDTIHISSDAVALGASGFDLEILRLPSGINNLTFTGASSDCTSASNTDRSTLDMDNHSLVEVWENNDIVFKNLDITGGGFPLLYVLRGDLKIKNSTISYTDRVVGKAISGTIKLVDTEVWGTSGNASAFTVEGNEDIQGKLVTLGDTTIRDNDGRAIYAMENSLVKLKGNTVLINNTAIGQPLSNGGGVYLLQLFSAPDLYVGPNVRIESNHADYGGGIYADSRESIEVQGSLVLNTATEDGGGIYLAQNQTAEITNATFERNSANEGGGIWAGPSTTLIFDNSVFDNNLGGGAIRADNASIEGNELSISSNAGGGIYLSDSSATLTALSLWGNRDDPGIHAINSAVTIDGDGGCDDNVNTSRNVLAYNGDGAIYASDGSLTVRRMCVIGNQAPGAIAGVIHVEGANAMANIENSLFIENEGYALSAITFAEMNLTNITAANNINRPLYYSSGTTGLIASSILLDNTLPGLIDYGANVTARCNNRTPFDGQGPSKRVNNQNQPALFIDPNNRDFRLDAASPSIDTCNVGIRPDLNGVSLSGVKYDQGAYEFW